MKLLSQSCSMKFMHVFLRKKAEKPLEAEIFKKDSYSAKSPRAKTTKHELPGRFSVRALIK